MRKYFFPLGLLLCALLLAACAGCDADGMGTLADFSKPYAGLYRCETLTAGGKEMADRFDYVTLELKGEGDFTLAYRTKEGLGGSVEGKYVMDLERGTLVLSKEGPLRTANYLFRVQDGALCGDFNFNGMLLHAVFRTP